MRKVEFGLSKPVAAHANFSSEKAVARLSSSRTPEMSKSNVYRPREMNHSTCLDSGEILHGLSNDLHQYRSVLQPPKPLASLDLLPARVTTS